MAVEPKRGCGYRKVGGMYLVSGPGATFCDRLPILLEVCPFCGQGIKQSRGWTWVDPEKLFNGVHLINNQLCPEVGCPVCRPAEAGEKAGLLWVGAKFYSPNSFMTEARHLGVSKRIAAIPRGFEVGKTWIFLAHPEAGSIPDEENTENGALFPAMKSVPGIFTAYRPTRIEQIVTETEFQDAEAMERLRKRGITPVSVPDDDPDHR